MPWRQVDPMTARPRFIRDARNRVATFMDLCRLYGIARITGYKWLHRAQQSGIDYLRELSRRPHSCPHATPPELTARLLEARRHHPSWGPRKLLKLLRRQARRWGREPAQWPARSTVADHLAGKVQPLPAHLPGASGHHLRRVPAGLYPALPRMRPACSWRPQIAQKWRR
jgi:hypothetical protein